MPRQQGYVLGIDLASNSLGWAIIGLKDGAPAQLARAGVRVFEAGMEGDLQSGREESRNLRRREARRRRRVLWRRRRRLAKLFNLLQRFRLLPPGPISAPASSAHMPKLSILPNQRQDLLNELDQQIFSSPWFQAKVNSGLYPEPAHTIPYILRASALDEPLEPYFIGRALFHLAQRRGFLSNRKQLTKKNDDEGAVKEGIAELRGAMQEEHARTLGEYFSHFAPSVERIRCRWTARDMYQKEFNAIWDAQVLHSPNFLMPEGRKQIYNAIFYQRPLRFDPKTIGRCELEPNHRRAAAYLLVSQRFRLFQTVNSLRVLPPGEPDRNLTDEERKKLINALELKNEMSFKDIRKLFGLSKEHEFNLQRSGAKRIKGNRTNSDFFKVFGDRWLKMSSEEQDNTVEYVHAFQKPEALKKAAQKRWILEEGQAERLAIISLEPGYMNLSKPAMKKLMPLLREGLTFVEARKQTYPESFPAREQKELLPPVERSLAEIRNPALMRSLTELRKVVNAIIRQYGKPTYIHIELAHDLKQSRKLRQAISENNRRNEKARLEAAKRIIAGAGISEPQLGDIRKFLLAEECHWMCPYTGKSISMHSLFGPEPQFDIKHIIPFRHSMDDSFQNVTLCFVPENRIFKANKTPWQAYHHSHKQYKDVLARVEEFGGDRHTVAAKLKRFMMTDDELEDFLEDFRTRQLNDTAYATSVASNYLGLLFGGVIDHERRRRVHAISGHFPSYLRGLWKLNSILNDVTTANGGSVTKSREDYRHRAIDAVVVGLTDAALIKRLSGAAQRARLKRRRHFVALEKPWPNFADSVRTKIDRIVVSHRVSKKVSGALHEESVYSRQAGENSDVHIRKPLVSLTKPEVEKITDNSVKKLVQRKLNELGETEPQKAFPTSKSLPTFPSSGVPIKRVRIRRAAHTYPFGKGRAIRHFRSGSNHHVEIYAEIDKHGKEGKWNGKVISMYEAYLRVKSGKPIVRREFSPLTEFKFSLAPGEVIECKDKEGGRSLFVMRRASQDISGRLLIGFAPLSDARRVRGIQTSRAWLWVAPRSLRERNPRKVHVSPIGEVSEAHD